MDKSVRSNTGLILGPLRLLFLGLCVLASPSLFADKGHVTITNCGTEKVWIASYDWGDTTRTTAYESDIFSAGDQHTLHCVKNWFTTNSPGCWITVKDGTSSGTELGGWKVDNGTYTLGSIKEDLSCGFSITVCLKQQSECATAPSISSNTSDCLFRNEHDFTDCAK